MRIGKSDLEWAAAKGIIANGQVEALWRVLGERTADAPKFDLVHAAYYLGALLVIGAMGWFIGSGWERLGGGGIFIIAALYGAAFAGAGAWAWGRPGLRVPGGLLVTLSVCMTPLAVYGLQRALGVWPFDDPGVYVDFHRWIRGGWFAMEVVTVAAGLVALHFCRFPFLTAPIAFVLWYMSMDLTPIIAGTQAFAWEQRLQVSVWFGLAMLAAAYAVDRRTREDFAFWGYLFGLMAFWGGLSLHDSDSELAKAGYCLINVALMGVGVFLRRRAFMVFGAIGTFGYLAHLADAVFADSIFFSVALTALGVAIIVAGIQLKRHGPRLEAAIEMALPAGLRRLRPAARDA